MKLLTIFLILALFLPSNFARAAAPAPAENVDSISRTGKKTLIVAKAAMYGAAGGLVVGLASQAFHRSTRGIFMFGSLGLYAGIAVGLYAITAAKSGTPYEGPDTYDDYIGKQDKLVPEREHEIALAKSQDQQLSRTTLYSLSF